MCTRQACLYARWPFLGVNFLELSKTEVQLLRTNRGPVINIKRL
jgi:hypothetical protein